MVSLELSGLELSGTFLGLELSCSELPELPSAELPLVSPELPQNSELWVSPELLRLDGLGHQESANPRPPQNSKFFDSIKLLENAYYVIR